MRSMMRKDEFSGSSSDSGGVHHYHMLAEKRLDVRLVYDCQDNFITKEHYILMAVLKNLVNNAIEAIETKGEERYGMYRGAQKKEERLYI